MKKLLLALLLALLLVLSLPAQAAIVTKEIPYTDGDVSLTGFLAYDDAVKAPMPGVLVIHGGSGHNDHVRERASALAKLGYAAFALDMFGTGVTSDTPDDWRKLAKPFYDDRKLMRSRALTGLQVLRAQKVVDYDKIGVIGYSFGGILALELARAGADVKGVVSFHSNLATTMPAQAGDVKARLLVLIGGDDKFFAANEKQNFIKEMTDAKVNFKSVEYPGATHAFSNPKATETGKKFNMPIAYNKEADEASWAEMQAFLKDAFQPSKE